MEMELLLDKKKIVFSLFTLYTSRHKCFDNTNVKYTNNLNVITQIPFE